MSNSFDFLGLTISLSPSLSMGAVCRVEDVFQGEAGNTSSVREKLQKRDYQCPCGKKEAKGEEKGLSEPEDVGLLFSTQVGTRQDSTRAYLRPETAQGVYTQFANIATSLRTHLPFGMFLLREGENKLKPPRNVCNLQGLDKSVNHFEMR